MTPGYFVFIRGKVQTSWRSPDSMEFKITSMQLLSEVRDKLLKNITIILSLSDISDDFVTKLTRVLDENAKKTKGTCSVKFHVVDPDANLAIDMPSRRLKVSPDNELLEIIQKEMNLNCKLN